MLYLTILCMVILACSGQYIDGEFDIQDDGHIWMDMSKVAGNNTCFISINKTSCQYFQHYINVFNPNFIKLKLRFRYVHGRYSNTNTSLLQDQSIKPYLLEPSTSFTEEVIRPYEWVWTYYSTNDFFPYLKWPTDFSIASFNLLAAKTLKVPAFLAVEIHNLSCYITIGQRNTTDALSYAFRDLTRDFLIGPKYGNRFDYSYWCYLCVVPGVKETLSYKLGIHLGYTSAFVQYNCCRTMLPPSGNQTLKINCFDRSIAEMWQGTILPYILGVIATAFSPLVMFKLGAKFRVKRIQETRYHASVLEEEDWDVCSEMFNEWIFLEERSPISFSYLVIKCCGLGNKHPVLLSRMWRFILILLGPVVIYYQLYVYNRYQYDTIIELIDHDIPLGYLSMLGGFEKSRRNFMPFLGGPYCLLAGYYVSAFTFILTPSYFDRNLYNACNKYLFLQDSSPLVYSMTKLQQLSHVTMFDILCGYKRSYALSKVMFYMVFNPKFWLEVVKLQISRFQRVRYFKGFLRFPAILVYTPVCLLEVLLTVVYYGIPFINALGIVMTCFCIWVKESLFEQSRYWKNVICFAKNCVLCLLGFCLLLYGIISVFTILSLSFAYLGKIVVFCFISVIVYPSTSFGFLFFGIVFVYYIFKIVVGIGDEYLELLADVVDISSQLENGLFSNQVIDKVLIVNDDIPSDINKIQIRDCFIHLSSIQQKSVHDAIREPRKPKTIIKNNHSGIPRDLFKVVVEKHHPVYIEITHALMKISVIMALIYIAIGIINSNPTGPSEGISEMMHVVFIVVIGALPRVLELVMDGLNQRVQKEIHLRELKCTINQYWCCQYDKINGF